MPKKILIVEGSPRPAGNSEILSKAFQKGAEEAGNFVELVNLSDKKVGFCKGCYYCASHSGKCFQKDDVEPIIQKMIDSDVLVFATPTYFYSMSGQMKTFIDRTVCRYTEMKNKEIYFIVTSWDPSIENIQPVITALRGFTSGCLEGAIEKGIIYGTGLNELGEAIKSPHWQEAYEMGKKV